MYLSIALSGACALGAEVVWTRLLGLLLGATVYTFSIILAVFLVGLGIGSGAGSLLARQLNKPRLELGCCQMLLAAAVAWTAYMLSDSLPYWPINPLLSTDAWVTFQVDLVRSLWAVLPAALLWGASFPLALAAVAAPGEDSGRMVGGIYAANTAGAILGALGFSLLLIPQIGTARSERVLIILSTIGGLVLLAPLVGVFQKKGRGLGSDRFYRRRRAPGPDGSIHSRAAHRLRTPHHDLLQPRAHSLCRRRNEFVHRHLGVG